MGGRKNPAVHSQGKLMLVSGTLSAVSWQQLALTQPARRTPLGGAGLYSQPSVPYLHSLTYSLCPVFQLENISGSGSLYDSLLHQCIWVKFGSTHIKPCNQNKWHF